MGDYLGSNNNEVMEGQFANNGKREKRPPYQFRSGAVYEGEWICKAPLLPNTLSLSRPPSEGMCAAALEGFRPVPVGTHRKCERVRSSCER